MYSLDEVGHTPPMGGGVVDLLKATRGARTKLGKTAPFTPSCDDEAVGISPPKTPDQVFTPTFRRSR